MAQTKAQKKRAIEGKKRNTVKSEWKQLVDESGSHMIESTPTGLLSALSHNTNPKSWKSGGYANDISSIKTNGDLISVHTERGGKYSAGGVYYVNKNNKKQSIGDF